MIKVAVIGCGYWGPNLIRNFIQIRESKVKYCCDLDEEKLRRIKSLYPDSRVTQNYRKILNDPEVEAVAIATPVYTHFELAKEGLEVGKHVFVEKPLTHTSQEARELIRLARKKGKVLMVGHTFLYTAAVNKLKELIDSGELGDVLYISSQRRNLGLFQDDINVVWDLGTHDISVILYLLNGSLGEKECRIVATGQSHFLSENEDVAFITLNFSDNVVANLHLSWLDPCKIRNMTIVGSRKMVVYDDIETLEKVRVYDKGVLVPDSHHSFGEFQLSYRYGDITIPRLKQEEPLKVELSHFLDCIREDKKPLTDGENGYQVVRIIEKINESLKNGGKKGRINL
ncbi:MAG: Gfo/Idh/MocA family protein [bacterium]